MNKPDCIPLQGRHAMVTGGGRGIGAAVARALMAEGANVTVLGRRLDVVRNFAAASPDRAHAVGADVANPEEVVGEGSIVTEERTVSNFTGVHARGSANVFITQGVLHLR